jgi:hypothetical protein
LVGVEFLGQRLRLEGLSGGWLFLAFECLRLSDAFCDCLQPIIDIFYLESVWFRRIDCVFDIPKFCCLPLFVGVLFLLEDPVQKWYDPLNFLPLSVASKKLFVSYLVPVVVGPSLLDGVFRVILKSLRLRCFR